MQQSGRRRVKKKITNSVCLISYQKKLVTIDKEVVFFKFKINWVILDNEVGTECLTDIDKDNNGLFQFHRYRWLLNISGVIVRLIKDYMRNQYNI